MVTTYSIPAVFDRGSVVAETLGHGAQTTLENGNSSNQWALFKTDPRLETAGSEINTNPELGGSYD